MPKQYILLPQARIDLQHITRYIAEDNPAAARKMKAAMMAACVRLGESPYIGQTRTDLTAMPVRFWPVHRSYMLIYDADASPVRILRIYNPAMHISSILPE